MIWFKFDTVQPGQKADQIQFYPNKMPIVSMSHFSCVLLVQSGTIV